MSSLLSVVVVSYNIPRELPRTIATLRPSYQRDILGDDYEVIVVDNGSEQPATVDQLAADGLDLRVIDHGIGSPSPVGAVNAGLNASFGRYVGVFIDGARMLSPGLLGAARSALEMDDRVIVSTRGRYLGSQLQRDAAVAGYDQAAEDRLLASVPWESDGDRLFDISVFDESSGPTWFSPIAESNGLFMARSLWAELGGFDPAFSMPGGGLVNLDTWRRACDLPRTRIVTLLGEATFHQFHGGVATNGSLDVIDEFHRDYERIRAQTYEAPRAAETYFGSFRTLPPASELAERPRSGPRTASAVPIGPRAERLVARLPDRTQHGAVRITRAARLLKPRSLVAEIRRRRQIRRLVEVVRSSDLFDADWYCERYPDVVSSGIDPVLHYVRYGSAPLRSVGPAFDGAWYLDHHQDVDDAGSDPLLHYLLHGRNEGRRIERFDVNDPVERNKDRELIESSEFWNSSWYLECYPAARMTGRDAIEHYVAFGASRGYHPSPDFDAERYVAAHPDDALVRHRPLAHYLLVGRSMGVRAEPVDGYAAEAREEDAELVRASGLFDPEWYVLQNPTVADSGLDPVLHYLFFGWRRGLSPSPDFNARRYEEANPDVVEATLNPLMHYLRRGRVEGRIAESH